MSCNRPSSQTHPKDTGPILQPSQPGRYYSLEHIAESETYVELPPAMDRDEANAQDSGTYEDPDTISLSMGNGSVPVAPNRSHPEPPIGLPPGAPNRQYPVLPIRPVPSPPAPLSKGQSLGAAPIPPPTIITSNAVSGPTPVPGCGPQNLSKRTLVIIAISLLVLVIMCGGGYLIWSEARKASHSEGETGRGPMVTHGPMVTVKGPIDTNTCGLRCTFASPCVLLGAESVCTVCRHAIVNVASHTALCAASCAQFGATVVTSLGGVDICEERSTRNVAVPELKAKCKASSVFSNDTTCEQAMSTTGISGWVGPHGGPGGWIQIDFAREYILVGLELWGMNNGHQQCSHLEFIFSGKSARGDFPCKDKIYPLRWYYFPPVKTKYVRVKCLVNCGEYGGGHGNFGMRHLAALALA